MALSTAATPESHRRSHDVPAEREQPDLPVEPDEGLIPPAIPEDPEHDRLVDPATTDPAIGQAKRAENKGHEQAPQSGPLAAAQSWAAAMPCNTGKAGGRAQRAGNARVRLDRTSMAFKRKFDHQHPGQHDLHAARDQHPFPPRQGQVP